jgi:hypothetical protein
MQSVKGREHLSGARKRLGLSGRDPVSGYCEDGNKLWGGAIIGGKFIE